MELQNKYQLREQGTKKYNNSDSEFDAQDASDEEFEYHKAKINHRRTKNSARRRRKSSISSNHEENIIELDRLPKNIQKL